MHLLLDVDRRSLNDEVAPVLFVFPAPDELGIEIGVPRIPQRARSFVSSFKYRLMLCCWNVFPLVGAVLEGLHGLRALDCLLRHYRVVCPDCASILRATILL